MRRKRRDVAVFGMSFLDCISCGFGAAILLFMLVDHARIDRDLDNDDELTSRVNAVENQLLDDAQEILALRAALDDNRNATETAAREAERLREQIETLRSELPEGNDAATTRKSRILKLQEELLALESRVEQARAASKNASGDATRTVVGEGRRQYLQGLDVSGRRILILVDASASMLDNTIVGAIRRRNMSTAQKLAAPKWRRTVAAVDWITAQIDPGAQFQMATFAEETRSVLGGGNGWLPVGGGARLSEAVRELRKISPAGGTNLDKAFSLAARMSPRPDKVYLITDGLPTQGERPASGAVSGRERARLFAQATNKLPGDLPINIILMPMEGDPRAASSYWQLARASGGAFFEPARDWP